VSVVYVKFLTGAKLTADELRAVADRIVIGPNLDIASQAMNRLINNADHTERREAAIVAELKDARRQIAEGRL